MLLRFAVPVQAALIRVEEMYAEALDNLQELCAFGPDDGGDCSMKVTTDRFCCRDRTGWPESIV